MIEEKERLKKLEKLVSEINKKAAKRGTDSPIVFRAGDRPDLVTAQFYPCGIDVVDKALGGGFCRGGITTLWGPYNCGKSWLAATAAAKMTKEGGFVLYINLEQMPLALWEKELGMDLNKVFCVNAQDCGDEVIDIIEGFLYDKDAKAPLDIVDMVIVDSISNFVPKANTIKVDKDGAEGGGKVGAQAKLIADFLTRYYGRGISTGKQVVILISQVRSVINTTGYGPTTQMSGGNAPLHNSKIIVKMGKQPTVKLVSEPGKKAQRVNIGHVVTLTVEKNSLTGIPGAKAEYPVIYGKGLDDSEALIQKGMSEDWQYIIPGSKKGYYTIICPGLGDVEDVKKADLTKLVRERAEIADSLRRSLSGAKPSTPPVKVGKPYTINLEEDIDEEGEEDLESSQD